MESVQPQSPVRLVCVHNRNRDGYQVPLALAEAGLLEAFVTDFYAGPVTRALFPGLSARRSHPGLAAARCRSSPLNFALQLAAQALGLPMQRVFAWTDRLLAEKAARLARRRGAGLLAYSSYLAAKPDLPGSLTTIDFEYHPHPGLVLEILAADHARFPEVSQSFARECETARIQHGREAWRSANRVLCASAMTRRSLVHAGCPEERIRTVPYGAGDPVAVAARPADGPARFLFVGQGVQRKGLHHLALAWREAGLGDAELTVVSYGIDPGIRPMLDAPGITVLGYRRPAALEALFARSDVFVMPSLVEGFGLVYLEALRAGCHVIGTANTGLPDLDLGARSASLAPPGDIAALARCLQAAAASKASGALDPFAIAAEACRWQWRDFRAEIAREARDAALAGQG